MASLIDKLRAAQPIKKTGPAKASSDSCYLRQINYPYHDFPVETITTETLRLMMGLQDAGDISPENLLFLDTETTGLHGGAGTVAFLVGIGRFEKGQFTVRQYLMRDYDEEIFVLAPSYKRLISVKRL